MAAKSKDGRARNYLTEVYPESAPKDWLTIASDYHVPAFISPVHDKDLHEKDDPNGKYKKGDYKKPHYHVLFMFAGNKSENQVRDIFTSFGGVGCEVCQSVRGSARYFCHLDEGDKALYDPEDVICLSGADYFTVIELPSEKYVHIKEIMQFCVENEVYSFSELSLYAMVHRGDWFRILVDKNTIYIKEFLKSRAWDVYEKKYPKRIDDNGNLIVIDYDTGEVL